MNHRLHLDSCSKGALYYKWEQLHPRSVCPTLKMKPWTFHTVCHFSTLVRSVSSLCLCRYNRLHVYSCYFLLYEDVTMLSVCT